MGLHSRLMMLVGSSSVELAESLERCRELLIPYQKDLAEWDTYEEASARGERPASYPYRDLIAEGLALREEIADIEWVARRKGYNFSRGFAPGEAENASPQLGALDAVPPGPRSRASDLASEPERPAL